MDDQFEWDVFISYASEDRDGVVSPLVETLSQFGLQVWWDQFELRVGDSLLMTITKGLTRSRYGVVIISKAFLEKRWPEYELIGLTTRELAGPKVVLPAWYGVSHADVISYSPTLADKKAIVVPTPPTSEAILDACVEILEVVEPELLTRVHRRTAHEYSRRHASRKRIKLSDVRAAPYRHESLPDSLMARIRLVRAALLSSHPMTMEHWVDGFRRDAHPSKEVELWEQIAGAYLEIFQYIRLDGDEQKSIYLYFLLRSLGQESPALPESVEEHRGVLNATWLSLYPVVEVDVPDDPFEGSSEEDPEGTHIERFDDKITPQLAAQLVERLERNMSARDTNNGE